MNEYNKLLNVSSNKVKMKKICKENNEKFEKIRKANEI